MEVGLLGPVEIRDEWSSFRLPGEKLRTIVAVLALRPGQVVSCDELINELWTGTFPAGARNALQAHVTRLRKILGGRLGEVAAREVLRTHPSGYSLDITADSVDAERFVDTVEAVRGTVSTDLEGSAHRLGRAMRLWRGPALLDVGDGPVCRAAAARLDETRLVAMAAHIDMRMSLGRHETALTDLEHLVSWYPLREHLCEQLMTALYRYGRQSDALDAYQRIRQRLDAELGLAPGPSLQSRMTQILNHDPVLTPSG
jgi:DNA-binding SARP family transcriptional activator